MAHYLISAGGTGGHLFPAESLARALIARGHSVDLVTDERVSAYGRDFPARQTFLIPSATFASKNPIALIKTLVTLVKGIREARRVIKHVKPQAVIGFGGYPTFPPLFAAITLKIPTMIHEQNAVMGRANSALAKFVTKIATGFPGALDGKSSLKAKSVFTGNPLRPKVIEAAKIAYSAPTDKINLLVFGGSQGAKVFSDVVPDSITMLTPSVRQRLTIVQQAREEDVARVKAHYEALGVEAHVSPFFTDLPAIMAHSHLIIARSGASSVAEIAAIGRASILVPLPHSLDNDQLKNAALLSGSLAALLVKQSDFTPTTLSELLARLFNNTEALATMAENAKSLATLNAAEILAQWVETL